MIDDVIGACAWNSQQGMSILETLNGPMGSALAQLHSRIWRRNSLPHQHDRQIPPARIRDLLCLHSWRQIDPHTHVRCPLTWQSTACQRYCLFPISLGHYQSHLSMLTVFLSTCLSQLCHMLDLSILVSRVSNLSSCELLETGWKTSCCSRRSLLIHPEHILSQQALMWNS